MSGSPGRQCPAAISRPITARSWAAVTGGVVGRAEPHRVQQRGPRGAAGFQGGDERVRPARDQLGVALPAAIDVAEQPFRAGRGVRAQPRADVHGEHDPPVRGPRQRQGRQRCADPFRFHPSMVQRVVHRPVPAPMLGHQRQLDQRRHRPISAQHRLGQLEQRISPRGQRRVELEAEPGQLPECRGPSLIVHTTHRSPCVDLLPSTEA